MAKIPLEIIDYTSNFRDEIQTSISIANSLQDSFNIELITSIEKWDLNIDKFEDVDGDFVVENIIEKRNQERGFYPFLLAITDKYLYNEEVYNLFSTNDEYKGVGIFTTYNVPKHIIPEDKMVAYFLYYFIRNILSFSSPENQNHEETKSCLYDTKMKKIDILKSMKEGSLCQECKEAMFSSKNSIVNNEIIQSTNKILKKCNEILESVNLDWNPLVGKKNETSKEKIIDLICKSEIIKAIEATEFGLRLKEESYTNLLLFKSQYNRFKKSYITGLMTFSDFNVEQNRITKGLIELIKKEN